MFEYQRVCFDLMEFPEVVAFRQKKKQGNCAMNQRISAKKITGDEGVSLTIHVDQIICTTLVLKSKSPAPSVGYLILQTPTWCVLGDVIF